MDHGHVFRAYRCFPLYSGYGFHFTVVNRAKKKKPALKKIVLNRVEAVCTLACVTQMLYLNILNNNWCLRFLESWRPNDAETSSQYSPSFLMVWFLHFQSRSDPFHGFYFHWMSAFSEAHSNVPKHKQNEWTKFSLGSSLSFKLSSLAYPKSRFQNSVCLWPLKNVALPWLSFIPGLWCCCGSPACWLLKSGSLLLLKMLKMVHGGEVGIEC